MMTIFNDIQRLLFFFHTGYSCSVTGYNRTPKGKINVEEINLNGSHFGLLSHSHAYFKTFFIKYVYVYMDDNLNRLTRSL